MGTAFSTFFDTLRINLYASVNMVSLMQGAKEWFKWWTKLGSALNKVAPTWLRQQSEPRIRTWSIWAAALAGLVVRVDQ
jgi:hypothetical protein